MMRPRQFAWPPRDPPRRRWIIAELVTAEVPGRDIALAGKVRQALSGILESDRRRDVRAYR